MYRWQRSRTRSQIIGSSPSRRFPWKRPPAGHAPEARPSTRPYVGRQWEVRAMTMRPSSHRSPSDGRRLGISLSRASMSSSTASRTVLWSSQDWRMPMPPTGSGLRNAVASPTISACLDYFAQPAGVDRASHHTTRTPIRSKYRSQRPVPVDANGSS
jgi:hypothetical protein